MYKPNKCEILNNKLSFNISNGLKRALSEGFFYIKKPENINLTEVNKFNNSFFKERKLCTQKNNENYFSPHKDKLFNNPIYDNGYWDNGVKQCETYLIGKDLLQKHFCDISAETDKLGLLFESIITSIFEYYNISHKDWPLITNNKITSKPEYTIGLNHYRPELNLIGADRHADSSYITLVDSKQSGLKAYINGEWESIDAINGYFIVNFGQALYELTKNFENPCVAAYHLVEQQNTDRVSMAVFFQPLVLNTDAKLFTYKNNKLIEMSSFGDYMQKIINIYQTEDSSRSISDYDFK